jgi:hypothetical protein
VAQLVACLLWEQEVAGSSPVTPTTTAGQSTSVAALRDDMADQPVSSTDALLRDALRQAVAISWDGCHKIYVLMDEESFDGEPGRDRHRLLRLDRPGVCCSARKQQHSHFVGSAEERTEAVLGVVKGWFGSSCPLRFVSTVEEDSCFVHLIEQGEDWA